MVVPVDRFLTSAGERLLLTMGMSACQMLCMCVGLHRLSNARQDQESNCYRQCEFLLVTYPLWSVCVVDRCFIVVREQSLWSAEIFLYRNHCLYPLVRMDTHQKISGLNYPSECIRVQGEGIFCLLVIPRDFSGLTICAFVVVHIWMKSCVFWLSDYLRRMLGAHHPGIEGKTARLIERGGAEFRDRIEVMRSLHERKRKLSCVNGLCVEQGWWRLWRVSLRVCTTKVA